MQEEFGSGRWLSTIKGGLNKPMREFLADSCAVVLKSCLGHGKRVSKREKSLSRSSRIRANI